MKEKEQNNITYKFMLRIMEKCWFLDESYYELGVFFLHENNPLLWNESSPILVLQLPSLLLQSFVIHLYTKSNAHVIKFACLLFYNLFKFICVFSKIYWSNDLCWILYDICWCQKSPGIMVFPPIYTFSGMIALYAVSIYNVN